MAYWTVLRDLKALVELNKAREVSWGNEFHGLHKKKYP